MWGGRCPFPPSSSALTRGTHMHAHFRTHMHFHIYVHKLIHTLPYTRMHTHVCTRSLTQSCTHVCTLSHAHTYAMCAPTYAHECTREQLSCTCTHSCMHTHLRTHSLMRTHRHTQLNPTPCPLSHPKSLSKSSRSHLLLSWGCGHLGGDLKGSKDVTGT